MARTTDRSAFPPFTASATAATSPPTETIEIPARGAHLRAELMVPDGAVAIVAVLHGEAGGRFDPSYQSLLSVLQQAGLATLRTDLLTNVETHGDQAHGAPFFDVCLLIERLTDVITALEARHNTRHLRIGLIGERIVATAALYAAAEHPERVHAVVTRSARPDLAGPFFPRLAVPTLLIVGARDPVTQQINEEILRRLEGPAAMEIVPDATHQFKEPAARDQTALLTRAWFGKHLSPVEAVC